MILKCQQLSDLGLHCLPIPFCPAVKFLELIFHNNLLSSILAKCVCDESCRGDFRPTSPKGLVHVVQADFSVYR